MILIFFISSLLYLFLFQVLYLGWLSYRRPDEKENAEPISVIIAAHNEEENLARFLPLVLTQAYPDFEVVLILDRCKDESATIAEAFTKIHSCLRIISISDTVAGYSPKKYAIEQGIAASKHDLLAFTDADCEVQNGWLSEINSQFQPQTQVVIGSSPYFKKPGLLNAFIRFETLYTAFQYIGLALWGIPYMAVGRNLAYRKSFFANAGGFGEMKSRISGDDDLLVNQHAKPGTSRVMLSEISRINSVPEETFGGWIRQKMRHLSASTAYSIKSKVFLALFHGAHSIFYLSLFYLIAFSPLWKPVLVMAAFRWIFAWGLLGIIARKWKENDLLLIYPLLDFLYFCYNLLVVPAGIIKKPKWE